MPFESPFNALRNQFRSPRINIVDAVSRDATSGTLATSAFQFNASQYPAGTEFRFAVVMNVSTGSLTGTAQLYNLTDGEVVTNTTLMVTSTTPTSMISPSIIPVGNGAGELKLTQKLYEVRLSVAGGALPTDIVFLSSAALLVV